MPDKDEDKNLMRLYIQGDNQAFEKLYGLYKKRVYAYINKRVKSAYVDDLYQAVFMKLHEKKHLYNDEYPFSVWFYTLIRHTIIDWQRKNKVQFTDFNESEHSYEDQENQDHLQDLDLGSLDEGSRQLLYQKFVEGKGYRELEVEFNNTSSNLRKKVSRLVKQLRGKHGH